MQKSQLKFCYYLFTLMSFQTSFFCGTSHHYRCFSQSVFNVVHFHCMDKTSTMFCTNVHRIFWQCMFSLLCIKGALLHIFSYSTVSLDQNIGEDAETTRIKALLMHTYDYMVLIDEICWIYVLIIVLNLLSFLFKMSFFKI